MQSLVFLIYFFQKLSKQWRGGSEAAGEAPGIMAPPFPQSCFFVSWSGTRIMS